MGSNCKSRAGDKNINIYLCIWYLTSAGHWHEYTFQAGWLMPTVGPSSRSWLQSSLGWRVIPRDTWSFRWANVDDITRCCLSVWSSDITYFFLFLPSEKRKTSFKCENCQVVALFVLGFNNLYSKVYMISRSLNSHDYILHLLHFGFNITINQHLFSGRRPHEAAKPKRQQILPEPAWWGGAGGPDGCWRIPGAPLIQHPTTGIHSSYTHGL